MCTKNADDDFMRMSTADVRIRVMPYKTNSVETIFIFRQKFKYLQVATRSAHLALTKFHKKNVNLSGVVETMTTNGVDVGG